MYEQQYNPYGTNVQIVKRYFGSAKVLILGILYLVTAGVNLAIILTNSINTDAVIRYVAQTLSSLGVSVPPELADSLSTNTPVYTVISAVGSTLMPILMAVAFILIFAKSRSASPASTPMAGLSILFVLSVIYFVSVILSVIGIAAVYLLVFLTIMGIAKSNDSPELGRYGTVGMVIVGVVLLIACIIIISYASSYKNFYRSARRSLRSVNLENKGATAYGVFCIIMAIVQLLSFLSNVFFNTTGSADSFLMFYNYKWAALLPPLIQIAVLIFTAVVAIGYGSYINHEKNSYRSPYGGSDDGGYTPVYRNPVSHYSDDYSDSDRNNY